MVQTQDVTLFDEDGDNSLAINANGEALVKSKITDGTNDVEVSNGELHVRANVPSVTRSNEPVNEHEGRSTVRNKIDYTVPANKVLYIQSIFNSSMEGKMYVDWMADNVPFMSMGWEKDGNNAPFYTTPTNSPLGPFPAGTLIRCRRQEGDSKNWTAAFNGYLEDA